jgi:DNA-directed RNA polymerase subunit RPC12/RpoP
MVGEVFAGLGAIKTAFDIAKGLKDIDDATRRNAAVIELQEKILVAQEAQSALINRVTELEKEVAHLRDWEADKKRYQLTDIGNGVVALALKPTMSNGEPAHYLCADCAAKTQKSYLQPHIRGPYYNQYKCNGCGFEIGIDKGTPPDQNWQSIDDDGGFMTS